MMEEVHFLELNFKWMMEIKETSSQSQFQLKLQLYSLLKEFNVVSLIDLDIELVISMVGVLGVIFLTYQLFQSRQLLCKMLTSFIHHSKF
jgi:hypothetical protein